MEWEFQYRSTVFLHYITNFRFINSINIQTDDIDGDEHFQLAFILKFLVSPDRKALTHRSIDIKSDRSEWDRTGHRFYTVDRWHCVVAVSLQTTTKESDGRYGRITTGHGAGQCPSFPFHCWVVIADAGDCGVWRRICTKQLCILRDQDRPITILVFLPSILPSFCRESHAQS